jgi:hypothetical protein
MSLANEGKLRAKPGKYRVVGVDTFEAPDADYLIGDVDSLDAAKKLAKKHGGVMNPVYVYDDKGKMLHTTGSP